MDIFVDTGAWYAVQDPDDHWHVEATRTLRALVASGARLITSNHVVGETYSLLLRTQGHAASFRFVDTLGASGRVTLTHVDEATEREAFALLRRFADQAFSFVDGTSFALMHRRRLRRTFAFDRHFSVAGFVRVPVDEPID
jgi:predicted nucleic acid-binding protein